jgi:hypothetical protein
VLRLDRRQRAYSVYVENWSTWKNKNKIDLPGFCISDQNLHVYVIGDSNFKRPCRLHDNLYSRGGAAN